jgi:hypothetical protein
MHSLRAGRRRQECPACRLKLAAALYCHCNLADQERRQGTFVVPLAVVTDRRQELSVTTGNLASALTRFIGRLEELAQVEAKRAANAS